MGEEYQTMSQLTQPMRTSKPKAQGPQKPPATDFPDQPASAPAPEASPTPAKSSILQSAALAKLLDGSPEDVELIERCAKVSQHDRSVVLAFFDALSDNQGCTTPAEDFICGLVELYSYENSLSPKDVE